MPVIGITTKVIEAKKKQDLIRNVKINNETKITNVREQDLPGIGKKGIVVSFEYTADYLEGSKSVAKIMFGGDVLFVDKAHGDIIKNWEKSKKLPDKVNLQVLNSVLKKCVIRSLSISEELGLPPTIRLPFASKKNPEESRYIG